MEKPNDVKGVVVSTWSTIGPLSAGTFVGKYVAGVPCFVSCWHCVQEGEARGAESDSSSVEMDDSSTDFEIICRLVRKNGGCWWREDIYALLLALSRIHSVVPRVESTTMWLMGSENFPNTAPRIHVQ